MSEFQTVALLSEIPEIGGKEVVVDGRRICLFKHNGEIFATAAECPHKRAPMACGWIENGTISCALHGWQFDLNSGECRNVPGAHLQTYTVETDGVRIKLRRPY